MTRVFIDIQVPPRFGSISAAARISMRGDGHVDLKTGLDLKAGLDLKPSLNLKPGLNLKPPGLMQQFLTPQIAKTAASAKIAASAAATWLVPGLRPPGAQPLHSAFSQPATLGRIGPLEVRLAEKKGDIKRAQKLRYKVFYKDGTAIADAATMLARRDKDTFDKICDHLMVVDH
ncbi:MAG TPA: GNAT family N-acyltransferase, partial [Afipia sp.]